MIHLLSDLIYILYHSYSTLSMGKLGRPLLQSSPWRSGQLLSRQVMMASWSTCLPGFQPHLGQAVSLPSRKSTTSWSLATQEQDSHLILKQLIQSSKLSILKSFKSAMKIVFMPLLRSMRILILTAVFRLTLTQNLPPAFRFLRILQCHQISHLDFILKPSCYS